MPVDTNHASYNLELALDNGGNVSEKSSPSNFSVAECFSEKSVSVGINRSARG